MKLIFYSSFLFLFFYIGYEKPKKSSAIEVNIEGDPLPCVNKQFPIALQIIMDSLGNQGVSVTDVQDEVDQLNILFDPICVSFKIDTVRIIINQSYDRMDRPFEFDSLRIKYHIPYRINLYIGSIMGVSSYEKGVATFEGITEASVLNPAIGIDKDVFYNNDNNFLAHYIGVYFGLLPTSYSDNGVELVNGSNCLTAGDGFCDTPADPFQAYPQTLPLEDIVEYYKQVNCRFVYPEKDANNEFYNPDVSNIMSYYTPCRCTFTDSQYKHVAETYLTNPGNTW